MTMVLDAGGLIALDRGDKRAWSRLKEALAAGVPPRSHGGVVGEVWRNGARQARLAVVLRGMEVAPLDDRAGRRAGALLSASGTADVIDAAVALLAADGDVIHTSDPDDLAHLVAVLGRDVEIIRV